MCQLLFVLLSLSERDKGHQRSGKLPRQGPKWPHGANVPEGICRDGGGLVDMWLLCPAVGLLILRWPPNYCRCNYITIKKVYTTIPHPVWTYSSARVHCYCSILDHYPGNIGTLRPHFNPQSLPSVPYPNGYNLRYHRRACSVCVFFSAYLGRSIPSSLIYMLFCVPSMHHFCLNTEPPRNFELLHAIVKLIHNGFPQSPRGHLDPTSRHRWQSKRPDVTGGSGADLDQQSDWRRAGGARKHGLDNPKCVGED
ncbi:hypothetical protein LY78DRAFT_731561 [Colletotrichum sublineola]|nr:hypothetical protein LY78DRAFT_731561 [Colletotrichum sublineola]